MLSLSTYVWASRADPLQNQGLCVAAVGDSLWGWGSVAAKGLWMGGRRCEESGGRRQKKGREVGKVCAPALGLR